MNEQIAVLAHFPAVGKVATLAPYGNGHINAT